MPTPWAGLAKGLPALCQKAYQIKDKATTDDESCGTSHPAYRCPSHPSFCF